MHNITCAVFGICFFIAGILFACGKIHNHLAGWKAMSQEEKDRVRIKPLCLNVGAVIALCGILFLLRGLWPGFWEKKFAFAMIAWFVLTGADIWFIGKSKRYHD